MAHLLIVRHAESAFNNQNRIQGHRDSGLTPKGRAQAQALARRIKNFKIDKVYSSDLGRAFETTQVITRALKVSVISDPLLREIHLGAWEGLTPDEVNRRHDNGYAKWLRKPTACIIPRGERIQHFRKRVIQRVGHIAKLHSGKTVLIVTHGGAITALLSEWLKADFDRLLINLQIDNTSLTYAEVKEKGVKLRSINDTSHLSKGQLNASTIFNRRS